MNKEDFIESMRRNIEALRTRINLINDKENEGLKLSLQVELCKLMFELGKFEFNN